MMNGLNAIGKLAPDFGLTRLDGPSPSTMDGMVQKLQSASDVEGGQGSSFQNVLGKLVGSVNETVTAPDNMMHDTLVGGTVDIHDLMLANAKADLMISVTTQVATKVIQAYDKILQIQI